MVRAFEATDGSPAPAETEASPPPTPEHRGDEPPRISLDGWLRYPWMILLAPLLVFSDGILGRTTFTIGDGGNLFVPWFLASARAWTSGHLPTWNPWSQSGMPQLGSSQAGVLYLPNLLFIVLPAVLANNLTLVISFLIAGLGAWLLARLLTEDLLAAAVGGLGFGLCTFLFAHIGHESMIAGAAWLPWMLYTFERLHRRFSAGRLLAMGAVIALAQLAGHSQLFAIDLAVLGAYVAGTALLSGGRPQVRPLVLGVLGLGTGLALGAVQLLPAVLVSAHSVRNGYTFAEAMSYSLPKSHLGLLAFPYLFGNPSFGGPYTYGWGGMWNLTELTVYPGAALLVLAAAAVPALRRSGPARVLVVVCGFCLVMVLGPGTPVSHLVFRLPVFGQFRAWARYGIGLQLGVAMLAAYGVAVIRRGTTLERRLGVVAAGLGMAGFAGAAAVLPHIAQIRAFIPGGKPARDALLIPCLAAAGGLVCAVALLHRGRWTHRLTATVLMGVVVADALLSFGYFYQWRENADSRVAFEAHISPNVPFSWGTVTPEPGGLTRYIFVGGNVMPIGGDFIAASDAKGWHSVNANNALMSADYAQATGMNAAGGVTLTTEVWGQNSRMLDLLRVSTVIVDPGSANGGPPAGSLLAAGTPVAIPPNTLMRYTYVPKLPEAYLVGATQHESFSQELDAIHGVSPFDPSTVALLDAPCSACPAGTPGADGTARAVTWGINTAALDVTAPKPGIVVVSQAYSPGWEATVDGQPAPVVRVDGLVQGVPVPAGSHHVKLFYRAPGLRVGFLISIATLAALLALTAVGSRRRRRLPTRA